MSSASDQAPYGMGWIPDKHDTNDKLLSDLFHTPHEDQKEVYQIVVDRAQKRSKFTLEGSCPPVYNQLQLGSCVANATAAALRFAWKNSVQYMSYPYEDFNPSRLWIYYYARLLGDENTAMRDTGCQIRDALKILKNKGVCTETAWPYLNETESKAVYDLQHDKDHPDADAMPSDCRAGIVPDTANDDNVKSFFSFSFDYHRIRSLTDIDHTDTDADTVINQMCACLSEGFPIIFGFSMYREADSRTEEFDDDNNWITVDKNDGTKDYIFKVEGDNKEDRGARSGGHAVLCIGFDRDTRLFRVMNSWGTTWMAEGFFWLPFSWFDRASQDLNLSYDLWTIRPHLAPLLRDHDPDQ